MSPDKDTTHFGFAEVPVTEKARRVRGVFDSVASRYDLMNDLMSLGIHRIWKRFTVEKAGLRPGMQVLDLAGGTGDLAALMAPRVAPGGRVVLSDINEAMLMRGRERLLDRGIAGETVEYCLADAEALPLEDASFDVVTIAFGLRNVTHKERALSEMFRVLRPGGHLLVLEFSRPVPALAPAYDLYSFRVLPAIGKLVAGDDESYRYLAESIRMHPDQETLRDMMAAAGFDDCRYHDLTGGIVALHRGWKY
ncbi:bifunctional demethylmenaquinone methyltransferase/2-methoxy-6-polyprenyl-1,4-benzoquinol methylase UbiE [Wenzhouxiangella sp. XN24]|uniref:bifunctional demethylmenaquinone methyltransferase/2-methoxy-6-polyprenyl-1,4-benzoquinol methylase UbiE n=1 Tax=Wenzhouxiangella sp. XN24 TaxID=2713569 RepID=UPI0013E9CB8B|nr:bifunctional demethylmenaquinone methyltransferase/2-methoxy-6-polyprenyl-1,4-benzoquinol methylase UbiE [Wenzhouxiangella sp. XN24]NGX17343.1 bifunctional demethylmenaquinone methyltransferase/2-methoxy-6-polyprenyl-1,4-benzoquinol methylase UbiE [Wenzhouxiangella sp. XN24]